MPKDRRKSSATHTIRLYDDVENIIKKWAEENYPLRFGQILEVIIDEGVRAAISKDLFKKKLISNQPLHLPGVKSRKRNAA